MGSRHSELGTRKEGRKDFGGFASLIHSGKQQGIDEAPPNKLTRARAANAFNARATLLLRAQHAILRQFLLPSGAMPDGSVIKCNI